jgi:hypothetical protein
MGDVTLADFLTMLCDELAATAAGTARVTMQGNGAEAVRMELGEVDVDVPAHIRVSEPPGDEARLLVSLPSLREPAGAGRLGRVRLRVEPQYEREAP